MANPPDGQRCETCAFYVASTCRRKLPEAFFDRVGWLPCEPTDWCFQWKGEAVAVEAPPQP